MEKIQISSWQELTDQILCGELAILCTDGPHKRQVKSILEKELGGRATTCNDNVHLYVYNQAYSDIRLDPSFDAMCTWYKSYITEEEFYAIYEHKDQLEYIDEQAFSELIG